MTIIAPTSTINILLYSNYTNNSTTDSITYENIQLEKGPNVNAFVPYGTTAIELCKIGDYQDEFRRSDGSNLWSSEWEQGTIDNSTGNNVSSTSIIRTKDYIKVEPNQHYAITRSVYNITGGFINVRCYDINKNYLGSGVDYMTLIKGSSNGATAGNPMQYNSSWCIISPKENVYYLRFNDYSNDLSTRYMMVKGDTIPDEWQPYGVGIWYKYSMIRKGVITNTNNIAKATLSGELGNRFYTTDFSSYILRRTNTQSPILLSNRLLPKSPNQTYLGNDGLSVDSLGTVIFYMSDYKNYTTDQIKTWLGTNNIEFYYALATPTYEIITYQPLIDQLNNFKSATAEKGQTNILQENNDDPFIIKAEAIKDLSSVLDRITLLED